MQVLGQHKLALAIIVLLLIAILIALSFELQNNTGPGPVPQPSSYPEEVTQYQGQNLTTISSFTQVIAAHPDVAIKGTQYVNQTAYRLAITGLVNNSLQYSYDEVINNFASYQQVATLPCVEGWSVTMLWGGVRISDLLQNSGVNPNATVAIFYASDGYTSALPLDYIAQNNIILAYKMNNVTLTPTAGFPLSLVVQSQYGYKWVKWVTEIEVSSNTGYLGYWESRGYPNNATVNDS
jgi:DMSO/TMAO reductase YedYZ molybdopterin-dependent catalytic subunit